MDTQFVSRVPFNAHHPDALAVYCSDGRFTEAVEDLGHSMGHPRLDTMTIPGGPALLDLTSSSYTALEIFRSATTFLVVNHSIKTVILVAHEGCGYYRDRHRLDSPESMLRRQLADLRGASRWLTDHHDGLTVKTFFAHAVEGHIRFDKPDAA